MIENENKTRLTYTQTIKSRDKENAVRIYKKIYMNVSKSFTHPISCL